MPFSCCYRLSADRENLTAFLGYQRDLTSFFLAFVFPYPFLSHPFGIVHSIPVLFLLYQRNAFTIKNLALYAVAGFLPIAAWGFYVIPNWELFL
jgi:hypothetical protein